MKRQWKMWAAKLEAMSVRERAMVAFAAAAAIVYVVYMGLMEPAAKREKTLQMQINAQRMQIANTDLEVVQKEIAAKIDPDQATKQRLQEVNRDNEAMRTALRTMQKGLVAPDKMSLLLEQMLHGNSKLRLVSLKTFPPRGMSDGRFAEPDAPAPVAPPNEAQRVANSLLGQAAQPAPGAGPAAPKPPVKNDELLYRHGVEIVLQGSYLDMLAYMEALEKMPAQLFWGKATLSAEEYPKSTLTLTLYTLSLDQKWIAL
ncbi:type II secretion system protein GspM [Pseudoduganella namucuonensis]|uniref:MSHA biogenesis protein MshJ n=1 Tax=Pseudoduganella namucuonensis TaxID=1035707 RepID=A0A1I7L697_9BURK|nr:type II secretion system protein GspM [Pseudoduganella namucuonensis]SFV05046.1 MSHA biogenesis protein MshJ [Pseudoduganella namucuonensis]